MTNPQTPDNQPQPPENRRRWLPLVRPENRKKLGIALGFTLLAGGAGGAAWLWYFVNNELAPIAQREITKTLNRPVLLGPVKGFSLTTIRFGPSSLPATPTDPDRATAEGVRVGFDVIELVANRTLSLQVTFINADAYIEQDEKGQWITVPKIARKEPGWIRVELDSLGVENAKVALVPYEVSEQSQSPEGGGAERAPTESAPPIALQSVNGAIRFREEYKRMLYEVGGSTTAVPAPTPVPSPSPGNAPPPVPAPTPVPAPPNSSFKIQGSSTLPNIRTTDLSVQAQDFPAIAFNRLLKRTVKLPITLYGGLLDANVQIQFRPQQFPEFNGTAGLKAVSAKIEPLPKLLTQTNGLLIFQPRQKVVLRNVATIYGKVPAFADGLVALADNSNLGIQVQRVNAKEALETLDVKVPVPLAGDVQASLKVNGPIREPVVSGTISSLDNNKGAPLQVERFELLNFGAGIVFERGNLKLDYVRAVPAIGGQISAIGNVKLGSPASPPLVALDFRATQLSGDAIARLYNISPSKSANFKLGAVAATGSIVGPASNLQTTVSWQAPEASYPASGTAIVRGALETVVFRDTVAKIADGTVLASGTLTDKAFSLDLEPKNLELNQLAEIVNREFLEDSDNKIPKLNQPGQIVTGNIRVAGNTSAIRADTVEVSGLAIASVAGGTASITGALKNGRWNASVDPSGMELAKLAELAQSVSPDLSLPLSPAEIARLPVSLAGAYITLSGTTNNLTADAINIDGNARLAVAGGSARAVGRLEGGSWQATVTGENVDVTQFAPGLPVGPVSGEITLAGTTADFSPAALRAGEGRLTAAVAGGTLVAENVQLERGRWQAIANISQINLRPFVQNAAPDVARQLGPFSGSFVVAGNTDALTRDRSEREGIAPLLESISLSGSGALSVAGGVANLTEIAAEKGRWRTAIAAEQVAVIPLVEDNLKGVSKNLPLSELGAFTGNITAQGDFRSLFPPAQNRRRQQGMESVLASIQLDGSGDVRVAGGIANVSGSLAGGNLTARVAADAIAVTPFLERNIPASAPPIPLAQLGRFSGDFEIAGNVTRGLDLDAIRLIGAGSLSAADGIADVRGRLERGEWLVDVAASDIPVRPFLPGLSGAIAQELGRLTGNFSASGTTESLEVASIAVTGAATLGVAGGTVSASGVQVRDGLWQSAIAARDVQIDRLSNQLRGQFSGDLNASGSLDALTPASVRAQGDVFLSQGVSLVKKPLNAAIAWDGERLQINRATAPGLNVSGFIAVDTRDIAAIQLTGVNLNVRARSYDLRDLPLEQLPAAILPRGEADFTGRIQGTPSAPRIAGDVQLRNFRLNQVAFDPVLSGNVAIAPGERVQVQLQGERDEIQINAAFSPSPPLSLPTSLSFLLRRGEAIARGVGDSRGLQVAIEQFPIAALNLKAPALAGPGPISGQVSGELNVAYGNVLQCRDVACALSTVQGGGRVAIAQPRIGVINANSFEGRLVLAGGVAELQDGRLLKGESTYVATGRVTCPWAFLPIGAPVNGTSSACADPQYQARVAIERGQLQDILTSLQIFRLQDVTRGLNPPEYASGAAVAPVGVSVRGADILTQLRRFSEIVALLEQQQQARKEASPLPDLQELQGTFGGEISVAGSLKTGVNSKFDISGEDWRWGEYGVDRVVVAGSFERGVLTLLPASVRTGDSLIAFSGTLGLLNQSGQLRVENFPVETLLSVAQKFADVPIPVQVTGKINASATLAGNLFNPQARGEVTLVEGTLNRTPVQTARGSFSYSESRLNFGSTMVVSGPEPIQIVGSIPYQITPFSLPPESDRISLAVNVQNEGLALLNVLSGGEVRWVSGRGQVQARVEGTLQAPLATGIAQLEGATIEARLLPEPLTNVNGRVLFNRDRIAVEGISGQFSNGLVLVQGVLPIFAEFAPADPERGNPLRVSLDKLALNLKGLYRGGVNGIVTVTGTAQKPQIGGTVELRDGQVLLSEAAATGGSFLPAAPREGGAAIQPALNDLKLILGKDVQIARPPILNFVAAGDLTINGPLDELKPEGTIRLRRGQVNLFTTQFRLLGGYEQTATFTPEGGLDPVLDVRLGTAVSEVTNSRLPSPAFSNEIEDAPATGLGETQTVRIQARVQGPASQLFDNLELTSSPSRTESEIVALLGGGFVNTLGRGDSTLAIANLAGSALLSPIESALINALGLAEFRLFPTTITRDGARSSTLGLAAEAGIDITRKLSASVIRVLTDAAQPTQFNLRYRLDNRTLLRGTTDFSGENRATVEYEIRF